MTPAPSEGSDPDLPAEAEDDDGDDGEEAGLDLGALMGEGGLDLGSLVQQAAQMQAQMASAQEEAAATVLEGVSGGGAVRVEVTGIGEFRSVHIEPAAVDPADVEMLEDLVLAALHDAAAKMEQLRAESMGGFGDVFGSDG
jgi:DNA-binding YbaB/EbfC family protein